MAVSPCVLTTSEYGWSADMERIMKAQAMMGQQPDFVRGLQEDHGGEPKHSSMSELKKEAAADKFGKR